MAQRDFSLNYHYAKKTRNNKHSKLFIAIVALLLLVFSFRSVIQNKSVLSSNIKSPLSKGFDLKESQSSAENSPELSRIVESDLGSAKGTYGVDIINLKTGEEYRKNENYVFES